MTDPIFPWAWLSYLSTKRQNFRLVQIEGICSRQNKCDWKIEILFGKGRKHCGKRRKCWSTAISPFSHNGFKRFFFPLLVVNSRKCVEKDYRFQSLLRNHHVKRERQLQNKCIMVKIRSKTSKYMYAIEDSFFKRKYHIMFQRTKT